MGFNSKYTGAEVEKRLDQNYYDDVSAAAANMPPELMGEWMAKDEFDNTLALLAVRPYESVRNRLKEKDVLAPYTSNSYENLKSISEAYTDEELKALYSEIDLTMSDAHLIAFYFEKLKRVEYYIDLVTNQSSNIRYNGIRIYNPVPFYTGDSTTDSSLCELLIIFKDVSDPSKMTISRSIRYIPADQVPSIRYDIDKHLSEASIDLSNIVDYGTLTPEGRIVAIEKILRDAAILPFLPDLDSKGINLAKFTAGRQENGSLRLYTEEYYMDLSHIVHSGDDRLFFKIYNITHSAIILEGYTSLSGSIQYLYSRDLSARHVIGRDIHHNLGIDNLLSSGKLNGSPSDFPMIFENLVDESSLNIHLADILNYIKKLDSSSNSYIIRLEYDDRIIDLYADYASRHHSNDNLDTLTIYAPALGPETISMVAMIDQLASIEEVDSSKIEVGFINLPYITNGPIPVADVKEIDPLIYPSYAVFDVKDGAKISLLQGAIGYKKEIIAEFRSSDNASFTINGISDNFSIVAGESIYLKFTWIDPNTILYERIYGGVILRPA